MKTFLIFLLLPSLTFASEQVGYGSTTATLTSKNQENIFMGFEFGLQEELGAKANKIIIKEQDRTGSQSAAISILNKLLKMDVSGIFGFSGSHDSVLAGKFLANKGTLTIFPGSNHNSLKDYGDTVFTTGHSMDTEVSTTVRFLNKHFNKKNGIAIINKYALASSSIDSILNEEMIRDKVSSNLKKIYLNKELLIEEKDLLYLKENKIDYLYVTTYPEALIATASQLEKNGLDIPVVAASSWGFGDADLLRRFIANKKAAVYFSSEWSSNSKESFKFTNSFEKTFGRKPTPENALGYDVGKILGQSINRIRGKITRESLLQSFMSNRCFHNLSVGKMCFPKEGGHSSVIPNFYRFSVKGNIKF